MLNEVGRVKEKKEPRQIRGVIKPEKEKKEEIRIRTSCI